MKAFKINHLGTKQRVLISAFREKLLVNKLNSRRLKSTVKPTTCVIPPQDDDDFDDALNCFGEKYRLPQSLAARLCDEQGELLFNPLSLDDINAIAALDSQVIIDFNQAISPPKASASKESSS